MRSGTTLTSTRGLVAIVAAGCTIVGVLLANRRHADVQMDRMQTALAALGGRVARIEGMLAAGRRSGEQPAKT